MKGLATVTETAIQQSMQMVKAYIGQGRVANRILLLGESDPTWFAVQLETATHCYSLGDIDRPFPLMSAVKPFLLLYLLEQYGMERVFQWVGTTPSDAPFNSLEQLLADEGRPRNPMINSGAIALAGRMPGQDAGDRCRQLYQWLNQHAGSHFKPDEQMLASVRLAGREPNQALIRHLAEVGQLPNPELALDTYEQICCLGGRVADLAQLGKLLAFDCPGLASCHRAAVNALMLTCGLYEASPAYTVRVGLPMKSGISGALVAIVPGEGTIACYSPALDQVGNPVAGLALVESLVQKFQLNLFI